MALFDKITQFFKKTAFEASPAPENTAISVSAATTNDRRPSDQGHPATPVADTVSLKEQFLDELRSIPVRHSSMEVAREDLMKELKRISPVDQVPNP